MIGLTSSMKTGGWRESKSLGMRLVARYDFCPDVQAQSRIYFSPQVPKEFINQHPTYANPPTLTMAITAIISRMRLSSQDPLLDLGMQDAQVPMFAQESSDSSSHQPTADEALNYFKSIYPPLKRHYDWFRQTQRGQIKQYSRKARSRTEAYRWRGRSPDHVLTSGMDDYPRGPPHAGELHLDLISWMGFFTRTMRDIANFVGEKADEESFAEIEKAILDNIEGLSAYPQIQSR